MSSSQTFEGVTQAVFDCVKAASAKEHGTIYDPTDGPRGTATTDTVVGTVKLGFTFDAAAGTITYTIEKKPFLAPEREIWAGISNTIAQCGGSV